MPEMRKPASLPARLQETRLKTPRLKTSEGDGMSTGSLRVSSSIEDSLYTKN